MSRNFFFRRSLQPFNNKKNCSMKKNVWVCGLVGGLVLAIVMLVSTSMCYSSDNFDSSMVLGYASMVLAFSLIFVGVKNYRDKYNGGVISFGKAFKIGLFITLIASSMYVLAWVVDYYLFVPDFMDKYTAHVLKEFKAGGATEAEIADKTAEMAGFADMYKNPLVVVLFTYVEVLPVGLVMSLISALLLKRKQGKGKPGDEIWQMVKE